MSLRDELKEKVLEELTALGRPAGTAELHDSRASYAMSTTRGAIQALEDEGKVKRTGKGRGTVYSVKKDTASGKVVRIPLPVRLVSKQTVKPRRWVILIDGEALILDSAVEVKVMPERAS